MKKKVIDSAINVQADIVSRLHSAYAGKNSEKIDPGEIGNFHGCVLGQWLNTHQEWFPSVGQYLKIKTLHRLFHQQAAHAVRTLTTTPSNPDKAELKKVVVLSQQLIDLLRHAQEAPESQKSLSESEGRCVGWSSTKGPDD